MARPDYLGYVPFDDPEARAKWAELWESKYRHRWVERDGQLFPREPAVAIPIMGDVR